MVDGTAETWFTQFMETAHRSNAKTDFLFIGPDGTRHADKMHGNGFGAHVKMFRRMAAVLFPGNGGMAIRNIEHNGALVDIWTVQDFRTGETHEVSVISGATL